MFQISGAVDSRKVDDGFCDMGGGFANTVSDKGWTEFAGPSTTPKRC